MATVKRNQQAIRAFLNSPECGKLLTPVANQLANRARSIGNAAEPGYGGQVSVSPPSPGGGASRDRQQVTITANHPASAAVEFGNKRTSASRPLRRASEGRV